MILRGKLGDLLNYANALRSFVAGDILRDHRSDSGVVIFSQHRKKPLKIDVFTTQADKENAAGVGMFDDGGKNTLRHLLIFAHLRAARVMRQRENTVTLVSHKRIGLLGYIANQCIDAGDRRDDPDFVAGSSSAVRAQIAAEGVRQRMGIGRLGEVRRVPVVQKSVKIRLDIMAVQPASRGDILGNMADSAAVFQNIFTGAQIPKGHFVTLWDIVDGGKALPCHLDFGIFCYIAQCDRNIIGRMNANKIICHLFTTLRRNRPCDARQDSSTHGDSHFLQAPAPCLPQRRDRAAWRCLHDRL